MCKSQFNWRTILISLCLAYKPIKCSNCSTLHAINFNSRLLVGLLLPVPMITFAWVISPKFSLSTSVTVSVMLIIGTIITLFLPYLVTYRNIMKRTK
ncbi:TIGR04104 family putative zinc finger protein [Metabacillus rhizosphaerae]|uniref:TIGR04104 family putative zinc finger protein n=1 Tax=Metabacillus rhizosphaerae TaxID=3117747 RepID=UPI0039B74B2F